MIIFVAAKSLVAILFIHATPFLPLAMVVSLCTEQAYLNNLDLNFQ